MQYQIICIKNRTFWNKILLFVALFVVAVYCISLVMPAKKEEVFGDGALYQQIEQQIDEQQNSETTQEA